jgi:hypothetical protein
VKVEGRKVWTPQGRMVANSDSERSEESATENTPPGKLAFPGKGEKAFIN